VNTLTTFNNNYRLLYVKISKDIWTSAQITTILEEPIGESNMVTLSGHKSNYISLLYSLYNYCIITFLLFIQLFLPLLKYFFLIFVSCKIKTYKKKLLDQLILCTCN